MAERKPEAYEGDRPYIFINYARADRGAVLPIVRALADEGYRVWWDDGIEPTADFGEYLADHVYGCDCLVMLISTSSLRSDWCTQEVRYALDLKKKVLPIYLEDVELTRGLQMRMGGKQALFWYELDSEEFYRKLFRTRRIEACLTDEGRRRRGVKPRVEKPTAEGLAEADVEGVASPEASRKAVGAEDAGHGAAATGTEGPEGSEAMGDEGAEAGAVSPESAEPEAVGPKPDKPKVAEGRAEEMPKAARPQAVSQGTVPTGRAAGVAPSLDGGPAPKGRPARRLHDGRGAGVTVAGVKPRGSLAAYSWVELKALSRAIAAAGSDAEGLAIARSYHLTDEDGKLRGDEKPLQLKDGTKTSVRILGFRHDELSSGGKAGISFEFANVPTTHHMNPTRTNVGGWEKSEMKKWLNSDFLALLPGDVRPLIEVRKRTNNKGQVSENDTASVTATADSLWLLSMSEVYGRLAAQHDNVPSSPETYDAEGAQYKLYADKGVSIENYGFCRKKKDGADSLWWLRSPDAVDSHWFRYVGPYGSSYANIADRDWGVSPGFCL